MTTVEVVDLRGLPLGHPRRKTAYPQDYGMPMRYLHLVSVNWYYDASDPAHCDEAHASIGRLVEEARNRRERDTAPGFHPWRVVVDNYGGTIIGRKGES
jgi:hypothetical protein